ncbi:MAG TPA: hypothetical protein VL361_18555, partial [Candidatus Limnocylindrales bacterium]|nr:hypothetical protein [Candidatus Limnocylindrales bacterium]
MKNLPATTASTNNNPHRPGAAAGLYARTSAHRPAPLFRPFLIRTRSAQSQPRFRRLSDLLLLPGLCLLLLVGNAFAQDAGTGATVTTDKQDYPPFSYVDITGAGFQPGETVSNIVIQIEGPAAGTAYEPWEVTADADGNFTTTWLVFSDELLNTTLQLTSVGEASGLTAQATFTDAGTFSYTPTTTSFTIAPGGNNGFTQDVTSPKNNGTFTAHLSLVGTGGNPIPSAWVSISPNSSSPQTFVTGGGS